VGVCFKDKWYIPKNRGSKEKEEKKYCFFGRKEQTIIYPVINNGNFYDTPHKLRCIGTLPS